MNKKCFVPSCRSNSADDPDKLFVSVPRDGHRRKAWFRSVGLDGSKINLSHGLLACEDHFNLPVDAQNWMYFKTMGSHLFLKKDVVPHIFQTSKVESQLSEPAKKRKALALQDYDNGRKTRIIMAPVTSYVLFRSCSLSGDTSSTGKKTIIHVPSQIDSSSTGSHGADLHRCAQCSYEFQWAFQLDHHVLRTHINANAIELFSAIAEPEPFQCVCCDTESYYNRELYEHCKQQHHCRTDEAVNVEPVDSSGRSGYRCDHCRYKLYSSLSLVEHASDLNLCKPDKF